MDVILVLRSQYHCSRKLLSRCCSKCLLDIDAGFDYHKYVAIWYGAFYWQVTHTSCLDR